MAISRLHGTVSYRLGGHDSRFRPFAEAAVGVEDGVEHLADGRAVHLQLGLAAGRGTQLRRNLHGD
jgi:hypothetical protein